MRKLETAESVEFGYILCGRLGVAGSGFEPLALDLLVRTATARIEAVFPFALRAALTCLGDSFTSAMEFPWIHVMRMRQAS
jgi:hypothetical protein